MKEVELLFKLDKIQAEQIQKRLKNFFVEKIKEKDIYLYPPHKEYSATNNGRENLRIRTSDKEKELCYKKVIYKNGKYSHAIEKNAKIDKENDILDILLAAEFRIHLEILKKRSIYQDKNFKYTIDKVEGLGLFLEIEMLKCGENESLDHQLIYKKANELGLFKIQDKGYLRLLEEKQATL